MLQTSKLNDLCGTKIPIINFKFKKPKGVSYLKKLMLK